MRDLARDAHLGQEPLAPDGIVGERAGQELQRDRRPELEVVGAVDLAHAAAAEQPDDAVAAGEHRSRRETSDRITREDPCAGVSTAAIGAAGRDGAVAVGSFEGADTGAPHEPQKRCVSRISHSQDGQRMCVLFHLPLSRGRLGDCQGCRRGHILPRQAA